MSRYTGLTDAELEALHRAGVGVAPMGRPPLPITEEQMLEAQRLRTLGCSWAAVAVLVGVPARTLQSRYTRWCLSQYGEVPEE